MKHKSFKKVMSMMLTTALLWCIMVSAMVTQVEANEFPNGPIRWVTLRAHPQSGYICVIRIGIHSSATQKLRETQTWVANHFNAQSGGRVSATNVTTNVDIMLHSQLTHVTWTDINRAYGVARLRRVDGTVLSTSAAAIPAGVHAVNFANVYTTPIFEGRSLRHRQGIVVHEIGHALGMWHTLDVSVMNANVTENALHQTWALNARDRNTLLYFYGRALPAAFNPMDNQIWQAIANQGVKLPWLTK